MNKVALVFDLQGTLVKKMRPPILNGNIDSLKKLKNKSSYIILFTGARKTETLNILKKLGLYLRIFSSDLIFTADNDLPKKPNPWFFKIIKKRLKLKNIIYIGDTKKDWQVAKNAKIDFIYVGRAKFGNRQVKNLDDLPELI